MGLLGAGLGGHTALPGTQLVCSLQGVPHGLLGLLPTSSVNMQHAINLAPHSENFTFQAALVRVDMGAGGSNVVDRVAGLPQLGICGSSDAFDFSVH